MTFSPKRLVKHDRFFKLSSTQRGPLLKAAWVTLLGSKASLDQILSSYAMLMQYLHVSFCSKKAACFCVNEKQLMTKIFTSLNALLIQTKLDKSGLSKIKIGQSRVKFCVIHINKHWPNKQNITLPIKMPEKQHTPSSRLWQLTIMF